MSERDCTHRQLARKCLICEMEADLATLRTRLSAAEAELALRKDYADQVRAQTATITRLGVELAAAESALAAERADARRLDWLTDQTVGYGEGWIARPSRTGRGYRLHESNEVPDGGPFKTPREAIDAAIIDAAIAAEEG